MKVTYDDSQLQRLFREMDPKRRTQALKGGFRKEANLVRKQAVISLRATGIRTDRDLEKGIRAVVFRRKPGFKVTVAARRGNMQGKGEKGMHMTRRGVKKPILVWAEMGTAMRRTKGGKRASHSTGRMRKYGFMSDTLRQVRPLVTDDLHRMVRENVERIARKYGCDV